MYTGLVYMYMASLIGWLLTPPSLTLCCVAPFLFFSALRRACTHWGRHLDALEVSLDAGTHSAKLLALSLGVGLLI